MLPSHELSSNHRSRDCSNPTHPTQRPELLAPAGDWDCVKAAVENGADAVYFGLERFNARMRAQNFTEADLPALIAFLHGRGVKGYVTFNTLVFSGELGEAEQYLRSLIAAGVDAAIVQDIGLARLIRHLSPDFPIHASTQMTITSAAGVAFAQRLGCQLVVLARECSLREIEKIQTQIVARGTQLPLEVFVHGALCVAYSGQCLTSEALGGRSANRGECAQACRMPYELVVDGQVLDLGARRYLLSPQDLAGLEVLPELVRLGVHCLKIEGRLKAPEYVASVTQVYRQALDRLGLESRTRVGDTVVSPVSASDRYDLEMAFSRGLSTGWFEGINNQTLVHGEYGKKRGVYLGRVERILDQGDPGVVIRLEAPLKPGDGVVFAGDYAQDREQGGRVYGVEPLGERSGGAEGSRCRGDEARPGLSRVTFGRRDLDSRRLRLGDRLYKTSDPELERRVRQTYAGDIPQAQQPLNLEIHGELGQPLVAIARDRQGHIAEACSSQPLGLAQTQPLNPERLRAQLGRLGNTPFYLDQLQSYLSDDPALILPLSELNRLRRDLVNQIEEQRRQPRHWQLQSDRTYQDLLPQLEQQRPRASLTGPTPPSPHSPDPHSPAPELIVLLRSLDQIPALIDSGITTVYLDFDDTRHYRHAADLLRDQPQPPEIWAAPPRIVKPSEHYILEQIRRCHPDGYLVRNYDQLQVFAGDRCRGDFSLNVANPLSAHYLIQTYGLERLTASYDLNIQQLTTLVQTTPPSWLEITIHQHMPMFHMEHCVFCAFLSEGKDFRDCGRPCDAHQVKLRDRTGTEHLLRADAGCRNTVFNGTAQTGAEYVQTLIDLGIRHFRLELVNDSSPQTTQILRAYQQLLCGKLSASQLWQTLKLHNQLGVTRGSLHGR